MSPITFKLKETKINKNTVPLKITWTKESEMDISKTLSMSVCIDLASEILKSELYKEALQVVIRQWDEKENRYQEKVKLFMKQTCKHKNLIFVDNNTDNSKLYRCYDCGTELIK